MSLFKFIDGRLLFPVALSTFFLLLPENVRKVLISYYGEHTISELEGIFSSIVAAFIFYVFLDVSKRSRETKVVAPYVSRLVRNLQGDIIAIYSEATLIHGTRLPSS